MKNNLVIKWLLSLPVILISLYFIPFLGICLIIFMSFVSSNKKRIVVPIALVIVGILILVFNNFDIDLNIDLTSYGKLLVTVGVIFFIINYFINILFDKLRSGVRDYIIREERKDYEISQKNDLIMKEKQKIAKNTNVVYCPYCGADNMLTTNFGTCKFCRRSIQVKKVSNE